MPPSLGDLMRASMKARNMTGRELAERIGRGTNFVSRILVGAQKEPPQPADLEAIGRELGLTMPAMLATFGYDLHLDELAARAAAAARPPETDTELTLEMVRQVPEHLQDQLQAHVRAVLRQHEKDRQVLVGPGTALPGGPHRPVSALAAGDPPVSVGA